MYLYIHPIFASRSIPVGAALTRVHIIIPTVHLMRILRNRYWAEQERACGYISTDIQPVMTNIRA